MVDLAEARVVAEEELEPRKTALMVLMELGHQEKTVETILVKLMRWVMPLTAILDLLVDSLGRSVGLADTSATTVPTAARGDMGAEFFQFTLQ